MADNKTPAMGARDYNEMMQRSYVVDYPPKLKKPYLADGDFLDMEAVHYGDFEFPFNPPTQAPSDLCSSGYLRIANAFADLPCGETTVTAEVQRVGRSGELWMKQLSGPPARVTGLTADFSDTACDADNAQFAIGDDCPGFSTFTVWLSGCSAAECGERPITCEIPSCGGTLSNATKQYSIDGPTFGEVVWSVTGTGASISQTGLLTTVSACGQLKITATDCCGSVDYWVKVTDAGTWYTHYIHCVCERFEYFDCYCSPSGSQCPATYETCDDGQYEYGAVWMITPTCSAPCGIHDGPMTDYQPCAKPPACAGYDVLVATRKREWVCP